MKDYATKLTLYDFISMLMPGSIIVAVLMLLCTEGKLIIPSKGLFWVFFFIASYLAGIVNHIVTSSLFQLFNFQNCPVILNKSYQNAIAQSYFPTESSDENPSGGKQCWFKRHICLIAIVIIGCIILCGLSLCKLTSPPIIALTFFGIYIAILIAQLCTNFKCDKAKSSDLKDKYYSCYYYVKKNGYGNDIEVIESQVAFLQSLILPILLMMATLWSSRDLATLFWPSYKCKTCPCLFIIISVFALLAIIAAIFLRQQKIYERVWEDYHYLTKLDKNKPEITIDMNHDSVMKIFSATAGITLLWTSCKKIDGPATPNVDPVMISLSLTVNSPQVRATDNAFEEGDQVGLYVSYDGTLKEEGNYSDNKKYTLRAGHWTADTDLFWKDQTSAADFYCYYPYAAPGNPLAYAFSVSNNQSDLHSYKAADLLWGKRTGATPSSGQVSIKTSHLMSNLLVYLTPGNGFTAEEFAAATKKLTIGNVKTSATVNLSSGGVSAQGQPGMVTPYWDGECFRLLLPPQDVAADADLLAVTVGNSTYTAKKEFSFQQGTRHKLTVTVDKSSCSLDISIEEWKIDGTDHTATVN